MAKSIDNSNDVDIKSIIIYDEDRNVLIDLAESVSEGKVSLGLIEIIESISQTSVRGVLSFDITNGEFEKLQLVGNEFIDFMFVTPAETKEEADSVLTTGLFQIYDFDESSNFTDTSLTPEGLPARMLTIKFTSIQEGTVFNTKTPFSSGFVGKIAYEQNIDPTADPLVTVEDDSPPETEKSGIINSIASSYFPRDKFYIEHTDNSINLAPKRVSFPTRKATKNMNLLQLINYCMQYSWKSSNVVEGPPIESESYVEAYSKSGWANYFFWQDLDRWNFTSVPTMVTNARRKGIKTFTLTSDFLARNRIIKMDIISDFSINKAFSDGMMYLYYKRIELNYSDLYSRFLDDEYKFTEQEYEYNYGTDYSPIVEPKKFLPATVLDTEDGKSKSLSDWIITKKNEELVRTDSLFGFYDNRQHRDPSELTRIIGRGIDKGITTDIGLAENVADYTTYQQDNMWQEMFDCVNIMEPEDDIDSDVSVLKKIHEIKSNTFIAKNNYKTTLNYKEKWNIYKYSVCCDVPADDLSDKLVIIKNHHKIAPNIYRYEWAEVAIIPKADLGFVVGFGLGVEDPDEGDAPPLEEALPDSDLYEREVVDSEIEDNTNDGLNSLMFYDDVTQLHYISHALQSSTSEQSLYEGAFPAGALAGTWHFLPQFENPDPDGPDPDGDPVNQITGVTGSNSWEYVKHLFEGSSPSGITLTFHNSQYSPFIVVEKENAARGISGGKSSAYNLNEIMNRQLLSEHIETGYPPFEPLGSSADIIYNQYSLVDGGDPPPDGGPPPYNYDDPSTDTDAEYPREVLIGPGIDANDTESEYPASFDMMPIGGYKRLTEAEGDIDLECSATPFGHIVKMSSVSYEDAFKVGIEPRNYPIDSTQKRFFYFSAENAHDGNCDGSCAL